MPVTRLAVRMGRRTRVAATGAAVFALAFLGFILLGTARPGSTAVLLVVLVGTTVLYTGGELLHSPAASTLAIAAAPEDARGRYLAAYQLSWSLAATIAPALFTALLVVDGRLPWLFLTGSVLAGAALIIRLERRLPAAALNTSEAPTVNQNRPGVPVEPSGTEPGHLRPAQVPVTAAA
ncbi:MFS transporter [Micromonospora sp. NBC_00389]|uniref:MFS transporter n=1 Tax=Micromonospora sp. NBC_00389 TaxID=2903586 RepID=UPI002E1AC984